MSEPNPEWLILAITLIALGLAPVASRLVRQVGDRVSGEVGGSSRDEASDRRMRDDEITQMIEARAYLRRRREADDADEAPDGVPPQDDELREEVRQVVLAGNERRARMGQEPLDVETEVDARLARLREGA